MATILKFPLQGECVTHPYNDSLDGSGELSEFVNLLAELQAHLASVRAHFLVVKYNLDSMNMGENDA